jgi:hypothetical protein
MQVQNNVKSPADETARRLRAGELSQVGATLTEDEMKAVAGAAMSVSWTCGSAKRADEWDVTPN